MSKKIRYAAIGMGMGRRFMEGAVMDPNSEVVAVCDVNPEKISQRWLDDRVTIQLPDECKYTDYKEMLKRDDIDVVVVASPDNLHCEMVLDSFKTGRHVICEKPLALNLDDCKKMIAASKEYDKKFMVGQVCRMTPGFVLAKKLIDAGEIGELFFVESEYAHDYSMMGPDSWRRQLPDRHGVVGGGCHAVDLLRWIAGDPIKVFAYSSQKVLTEWPTADTTISIMKFPNGINGKVLVSTGCKRNYTMRSLFYGTKGTIIVDNTNPYLSLFRAEKEIGEKFYDAHVRELELKIPVPVNNHNVAAEVKLFSEVLLGERELEITGLEGAKTVSACLSIIKSAASGKPELVDYNF